MVYWLTATFPKNPIEVAVVVKVSDVMVPAVEISPAVMDPLASMFPPVMFPVVDISPPERVAVPSVNDPVVTASPENLTVAALSSI